ncbi:MAG: ribosome biogenesis GTPase Der [Acidimicrobiales bacterium]|nr:ribosome biogenesis GTPase Der [Acidimicrobiales bacterium]
MLPNLAIVGRPNVGKSTLVNRLVGRQEAIVEERPGVTRDRKAMEGEWQGRPFVVIDTGGWLPGGMGSALDDKVSKQSERAMTDADAVLFVVDSRVGCTDEDARVAALLRRIETHKPVFVVVNKVDHPNRESAVWEFLSLGLGEPYPVSALHGTGTGDLLDAVLDAVQARRAEAEAGNPVAEALVDALRPAAPDEAIDLDEADDLDEPTDPDEPTDLDPLDLEPGAPNRDDELYSVAIVGRPNVGKSTLFNRLIGDDRAVVHDMPGTTRDAIDTVVDTPFGPVRFVDTAGMRRRSKIGHGEEDATEYFSMVRALRAVDNADVALLVIDATQGVTHQDQRLAERLDAAGCPIVILLNKWELLETEERERIGVDVKDRLRFLGDAPVLKISALTGKGVHKLLPKLGDAIEDYQARIPTATVNRLIREAQAAQPAPPGARVLYATQGATHPPTFTLFTNRDLPPTYLRYLERRLREGCGLGAVPIKLRVRRRG